MRPAQQRPKFSENDRIVPSQGTRRKWVVNNPAEIETLHQIDECPTHPAETNHGHFAPREPFRHTMNMYIRIDSIRTLTQTFAVAVHVADAISEEGRAQFRGGARHRIGCIDDRYSSEQF